MFAPERKNFPGKSSLFAVRSARASPCGETGRTPSPPSTRSRPNSPRSPWPEKPCARSRQLPGRILERRDHIFCKDIHHPLPGIGSRNRNYKGEVEQKKRSVPRLFHGHSLSHSAFRRPSMPPSGLAVRGRHRWRWVSAASRREGREDARRGGLGQELDRHRGGGPRRLAGGAWRRRYDRGDAGLGLRVGRDRVLRETGGLPRESTARNFLRCRSRRWPGS